MPAELTVTIQPPKTIGHSTVLHYERIADHEFVVLCYLPENPATPFVNALWSIPLGSKGWHLGHYSANLIKCVKDFQERVAMKRRVYGHYYGQ